MEDKRTLANQELGDTFGTGVLALKPEDAQNFVELPRPDDATQAQSGTVTNNFNVNVNVDGKSQENPRQVVSTAFKKALNSQPKSPEELKKNSAGSSPLSFQGILDNIKTFLNLSSESEEPNYFEIPESIGPTIPAFELAALDVFDTGDMSKYEYSTSSLKEDNSKIKMSHSILKNIVYHSLEEQNDIQISPQTSIDNSMVVNEIAGARHFSTITELNVEKNNNQTIQTVNELAKQKEKQDRMMTIDNNRAIQTLAKRKELDSNKVDEDIIEATTIGSKSGAGAPNYFTEKNTQLRHLNPVDSTISMFSEEMNSPPWWRTVLG